ncbi:MAG: outer membrane protein transport protein, partial [Pseudomonadales bacterium]|nr:outer membrane protein transport protein [Pseudomonadales bacterium]
MFTQQRQHTQRMTFLVAACLVVWAAILPSTSHAVLTDNLGIGNAKAISLGHAVTADPPGIDSIHFNPAGLAKLKGRQRQVKVITGSFAIEMEMGDYNSDRYQLLDLVDKGIIDQGLVLPEGFLFDESKNSTSQTEGASMMMPLFGLTDLPVLLFPLGGASYSAPESNITFGTNVYTPMAMGFYRADDDPGRFIGQRMSFMMLTYFSPSIAIQVTDEFSVGASINFNYVGVGLELPFRSPHAGILALAGVQDLTGCGSGDALFNDFCGVLNPYDVIGTLTFEVEKELTFGFNIGFLWEPTPWAAFGVVYQSAVGMDMEGDYQWVNEQGWVDFIGPLANPVAAEGESLSVAQLASQAAIGVIGITGEKVSEGTAFLDMTYPEHVSFCLLYTSDAAD